MYDIFTRLHESRWRLFKAHTGLEPSLDNYIAVHILQKLPLTICIFCKPKIKAGCCNLEQHPKHKHIQKYLKSESMKKKTVNKIKIYLHRNKYYTSNNST